MQWDHWLAFRLSAVLNLKYILVKKPSNREWPCKVYLHFQCVIEGPYFFKLLLRNCNDLIISFLGCMKEMYINHRLFDFVAAPKQHKVTPGCPNHDAVTIDPCQNHMCKKGKCVPVEGNHYECQCRLGWGGPFCDQGNIYSL